jgi:hypothetical protein
MKIQRYINVSSKNYGAVKYAKLWSLNVNIRPSQNSHLPVAFQEREETFSSATSIIKILKRIVSSLKVNSDQATRLHKQARDAKLAQTWSFLEKFDVGTRSKSNRFCTKCQGLRLDELLLHGERVRYVDEWPEWMDGYGVSEVPKRADSRLHHCDFCGLITR